MDLNKNPDIPHNEKLYQFYIHDNLKNEQYYHFKDNKIRTTKYNIITFLPKALLIQFIRIANIYFLICAILQCIPIISPLGASSAVIPILIVLSVSVIREGLEDCSRARLDKEQNSELTSTYTDGKWENTTSGKLKIGELVEVLQDEAFPADLILLDSELPEGICYIETGTLDGEKSLKQKESPKETKGKFNEDEEKAKDFELSGYAIVDQPNPELYQLNGRMNLTFTTNNSNGQESYKIPLDAKQLLLKGAKLKNTRWIIGIVVYTGHNCKLMKNAKEPIMKFSSVEKLMNRGLVLIFIVQAVLCVLCAILRGAYYYKNNLDKMNKTPMSFGYTEYGYFVESFLNYFTYLLLLNTLIPISLIITLEIVKLIQGLFMKSDHLSYSKVRKKWLTPNSVSLNEECGLVDYIFSDKTGTLTCNKMEFKYCVIGDVCYQYMRGNLEENSEKEENFRIEENITPFKRYQMYRSIHDEGDDNDNNNNVKSNFLSKKKTIRLPKKTYLNYIIKSEDNSISLSLEKTDSIQEHFWYALSLCHTCTVELNDKGLEEYICVSPDSIELVKAAKAQGWSYEESGNPNIKRVKVGDFGAENINFEKLQLIEFSSDRKRETIIIKNPEGKIILYCKGADSIIEKRLSKDSNSRILAQSKYYVDKFSAQGLRTLFVAMKIISNKEYNTFAKELNEAMMSLENKDKKVEEIYDKMEKNLYLIGTTIVEDKLQSKVPETIRDLRLAKIKIWMLTGDKMNTAYNIGLSCNLISKNMKTFNVCGIEPKVDSLTLEIINKEERDQIIINFAKEFSKFKGDCDSMKMPPQFGILVDEKALLTINEDTEIQKIFLDIAKDAVAVICCRVSPLQKSQVVKMMKNYYPNSRTLAIGDGGNDVSMIMEAHIGVGIYGEEGMRAVQSSDYAIGEFRFLHSLLFFHGRTNYLRNSECILYFFYKNFVFTILQFFFGFYCNFTGQTIIDDWYITLFNLLFTSLPLGARALIDQDVKPDDNEVVYLMLPFLYLENRENQAFTIKNFFIYLVKGTVHSFINFFWVINYLDESINTKGNMGGLWVCSVNLFTNILLIVSIDLLIYTKYHTWINFIILFAVTFVSYMIFLSFVHNMTMFHSAGAIYNAFISGRFWMNMIFVGGTCALIDFFILGFKHIFQPSLANILQMLLNQNVDMDKNNINELPKRIREKMEIYNEFSIDENEDKLKKEITQKTMIKSNNNELKLKPKNKGNNQNNYYNFNDENGGVIKDKNNASNELGDSRKNTMIQKDNNRYLENNFVKNRNNLQESIRTPSLENSNNAFGSKRKSDNKNISSDLKNSLNNDNKTKDFLINEVIYYNNHDFLNSAKKIEDDVHSQNSLIHKKKGGINGINGPINKNNNKDIYY